MNDPKKTSVPVCCICQKVINGDAEWIRTKRGTVLYMHRECVRKLSKATYIGDESVDCYTEETNTYTCDVCGKKFTMYGYQAGWRYQTETIDGEATEEEVEERTWEVN